jgi:thiamine kinase
MSPDDAQVLLPEALAGKILAIDRIKHGLTNDSWRVVAERDDVVIRRGNSAEASLQIDRTSEAHVLDLVARAGLGPQVVSSDPQQRVLITRYAGPTWTPEQALEFANIERIAAIFRRLHGIEASVDIHRLELRQIVGGYLQTLARHAAAANLRSAALQSRATHIVSSLRRGARACLCHNDVHALNIVDDGTLRLIDWEYAGLGEPYFDLASICVYHTFDRARRQHLLSCYDVLADDEAHIRLELACWLFEYVRDLWMAVRQL